MATHEIITYGHTLSPHDALPSSPAQARSLYRRDHLGRRQRTRFVETPPTAVRGIIIKVHGIDDAAAREGESRLPREKRQRRDIAETIGVAAIQNHRHVMRPDRAEADPPLGRVY